VPTTLQGLIHHPLAQNVFTCALTRPSEPNGFFTFGFIDGALTKDKDILWTDVLLGAPAPGKWQFPSEFIVINGKTFPRPNNVAVADTGTTLMFIDNQTLIQVYSTIKGSRFDTSLGAWVFPSTVKDSELPQLTIPVGSHRVTVLPQDLLFTKTSDGMWWAGSMQPRLGTLAFDLFGDYWLRNVYAIHDVGLTDPNKFRFGVVQRNNGTV
jgi:hypothetical protein